MLFTPRSSEKKMLFGGSFNRNNMLPHRGTLAAEVIGGGCLKNLRSQRVDCIAPLYAGQRTLCPKMFSQKDRLRRSLSHSEKAGRCACGQQHSLVGTRMCRDAAMRCRLAPLNLFRVTCFCASSIIHGPPANRAAFDAFRACAFLVALSCWCHSPFGVKMLLCVPVTSAPCERVFSTAGMTVNKQRNSLLPEKVNKLLCLRNWGNHR